MVVGPVVGGLSVDLLSWRLVFLINVVPIAVTLGLLVALRRADVRTPGRTVDVSGALLCTVGLGGMVFALIEQPNLGWSSPVIWAAGAVGVVSFAGFLVRQATAADPMMPLDLFRARNFWAGNLTTAFVYAALTLNGFVVGVYLQQGAGLSATLAGLATLPITILMILFSARVGSLAGRWGPRLFMTLGPLVMAVGGLLLLSVDDPFDYATQVLPGVIVFGAGLTLTVSPLTSAILGAIDTSRSGIASAVNNAISRVAGLVVIAMLATIVGGTLDLDGFHRAAVVTAALLAVGAAVSFLGIRNDVTSRSDVG
tara:strand:- start:120 stop:1055 length:936 start_codon:yes stop_codon:yes gene_type:complete